MFNPRGGKMDQKSSFDYPTTKLKNITCVFCGHQFYVRDLSQLKGSHVPLLMSCGHSSCDRCVVRHSEDPCRVCGTTLRHNGLQNESPPMVNAYILGLIGACRARSAHSDEPDMSFDQTLVAKIKQNSIKQCRCYECALHAVLRCRECDTLYCRSCFNKIHGKFRSLSTHRTVLLAKLENDPIFETATCDVHNQVLDYYCNDCCISSCSHCMLQSHQGHSIVPLTTKNEEYLLPFQMVQNKIGETLQRVHQTQKKIQKILIRPEHFQSSDTVEADISKHFAYLHGVLQNAEKDLTDKLDEQRNNLTRNLNDIQQHLKIQEDELQSAILMTANVKDIISRVNLKDVIPKLERLADTPCHLVQDPILDAENIVFSHDRSIISALGNHCKLEIPEMSGYNLLPKENLPENYELEPLNADESSKYINESMFLETSRMKRASSCQSLSSRRSEPRTLREGGFDLVQICHIEHPSNFYVRRASYQRKIEELESKLDTHAKQNPIISDVAQENNIYVVKNELNGKWYRGRVIAINANLDDSDTYEVFDLDNGSVEHRVPKERMRYMSSYLMTTPPMVINCALYDIVPKNGKWTPEACEAMANYSEPNEFVTMHVVNIQPTTYYVDISKEHLKNKGTTNVSLRDFLIYSDFGTLNTTHQLLRTTPQAVRRFYREEMDLNVYYDVTVTHVESPDRIYVQKEGDHHHYLAKLSADMNTHYNNKAKSDDGIIHIPEIGIPCAVEESEGLWYRGLINDTPGSRMVNVILVDFGTVITTKYEKIRKLHEKYMICPTQAIAVALADIKPAAGQWNQEDKAFIVRHLQYKRARVFIFEKHENGYIVGLYIGNKVNVASLMVKRALAIRTESRSLRVAGEPIVRSKPIKQETKVRNIRTVRTKKSKRFSQNSGREETRDPFKLQVKIIRVISPDAIYVTDPNGEETYQLMMSEMQAFYNRYEQRSIDSEWKVDLQCAIYSEQDRSFCRGKIIAFKSPEEVEVSLYDLGFTEIISIAKLQSLKKRFWKTPIYTFKVKLAGIYPCGGSSAWPASSRNNLKDLIAENQNSKFYISKVGDDEQEDLNVDLWVEQVKIDGPLAPARIEMNSINRILVETGLALPIRHYYEKKKRVLALELQRQISHTDEGEKTETLNSVTNGKFTEKKIGNGEVSIRDIDSDEESILSDKSYVSGEEEENDGVLSPMKVVASDRDFISSLDRTLVSTEQQITSWLPAKPIEDDQFTAVPTSLDDDCCLYLHSTKQSTHTLRYIETTLATEYDKMKIQSSDLVWVEGDPCIAQYHANKKWYRAQVKRVLSNDMIQVEFVDYGNIEECENGTLRKRLSLVDIPRQGTKCLIGGLLPNTSNGKWQTSNLDVIHALLIDRECEIRVQKRKPDHLVVTLIVTNPKRCELTEYLRNEFNMNVRTDFVDSELSNNESDSTIDESDDVVIDGYVTNYDQEQRFEKKNENNIEKVEEHDDKVTRDNKDKNTKNKDCNEKGVEESEKEEENLDVKDDEKDEKIEYNEIDSSVTLKFTNSVSNVDSEKTVVRDDENGDPADNLENLTYTTDEVIITGTANFTCSADEIEINQQEAMSKLDTVSLPDTIIGLREEDLLTSTPCNVSFDAVVSSWKNVEIPEDVQVVKAEVAKIGLQDLFMHLLDNKNSKILTEQRQLYEKTMEEMQLHADEQPVLKIVEKDTPCCAKFTDGKWYRCLVIGCESDPYELGHTVKVHFVDYGNDANVKSNEVRSLKEQWFEAPSMVLWCKLSKVMLAPTVDYNQVGHKIVNIYESESDGGEKISVAFYVKIQGRLKDRYEVEIYKDEECTELAYESVIEEGLYVKVNGLYDDEPL